MQGQVRAVGLSCHCSLGGFGALRLAKVTACCGTQSAHHFEYMNAQADLLRPSFSANCISMVSEFQSQLYFYKALGIPEGSPDMKALSMHRCLGNPGSVGALLLHEGTFQFYISSS